MELDVDEFWWEGDVLCVRTTDGQVWKFTGAYVKSVDHHFEDSENVTVTSVPLKIEEPKL